MVNSPSQLSVIGRPSHWAFFCASSVVMVYWGTQGAAGPVAREFAD